MPRPFSAGQGGRAEPPAGKIDTQVLPRHTGNARENQETRLSSQEAWQKVALKSESHCFLPTDVKLAGVGPGSVLNSGFLCLADDCETPTFHSEIFFFFWNISVPQGSTQWFCLRRCSGIKRWPHPSFCSSSVHFTVIPTACSP